MTETTIMTAAGLLTYYAGNSDKWPKLESLGLRTKTQWQKRGRRLVPGATPVAMVNVAFRGRSFPLYREQQTSPTRRALCVEDIDRAILAYWRRAKCRGFTPPQPSRHLSYIDGERIMVANCNGTLAEYTIGPSGRLVRRAT